MKPDKNIPGRVEATPAPQPGSPESKPDTETSATSANERPIVPPTSSGLPTTPTVPPPAQPIQASVPAQALSNADQIAESLASLPAEDSDVIEKVWIDKADEIVAKTRDDPYSEDEAQHGLSRAYLKKRFNLDVE